MMKKQRIKTVRIITIRHPNLRNLRYNLRRIIKTAVNEQIEAIRALKRGLIFSKKPNTDEEEQEMKYLKAKSDALYYYLKRSICECKSCHKSNMDMVYLPGHHAWYCLDCLENDQIWCPNEPALKKTKRQQIFEKSRVNRFLRELEKRYAKYGVSIHWDFEYFLHLKTKIYHYILQVKDQAFQLRIWDTGKVEILRHGIWISETKDSVVEIIDELIKFVRDELELQGVKYLHI